jgi:hypothetical protein
LARVSPAGFVEFAGRADNQVKIRGHRIELGEIEAVLDRHPDVVQSVVVVRGSASDARLVGFVRFRDGAAVPVEDLRKHVAAVLPDVMVPAVLVRVDAFPLTPNGKVDRKSLPTDVEHRARSEPSAVAPPVDDAERLVADIWESELDRPVGRDDNFFDIGGHSLLAVKVFRRLGDATSVTLALTDVFRYPTVRTFAAHINDLSSDASADRSAVTAAVPAGADRGAMRRRALSRRESRE